MGHATLGMLHLELEPGKSNLLPPHTLVTLDPLLLVKGMRWAKTLESDSNI